MGCEAQLAAPLYNLFMYIIIRLAAAPFWRHPG